MEKNDIENLQPEMGAVLSSLNDSTILHVANMVQSLRILPHKVRVFVASKVNSGLANLSFQLVLSNGLISLLRMLCVCDGFEQSNLALF